MDASIGNTLPPGLGPTLQITICCGPCLFSAFFHITPVHLLYPPSISIALSPSSRMISFPTPHGLSLQCMYITYHVCNNYTSTLKVKTLHLSKTPVYWYVGALVYLVGKDLLQCNSAHCTLPKGSPENEPKYVLWEETCNCVNYCTIVQY